MYASLACESQEPANTLDEELLLHGTAILLNSPDK